MDKVTIIMPKIIPTGGPESLHNLSLNFRNMGIECKIATDLGSNKFEKYFANYNPKYISLNDKFIKKSFLVIPEVHTNLIYKYKSFKKAVWWLSYINHKNSLKIKYKFRNYGLKSIFNGDPLKNKILSDNTYHFLQTDSSKIYLQKTYFANKNNIFNLESPLNNSFYNLAKDFNIKNKNSIVLNVAKLSKSNIIKIKNFFENRSYEVNLLKSKTREEVVNILSQSKFFLDLGPHPGQERLPREAILLGCLPIVSLNGTAGNYKDLPLKYYSKINCSKDISLNMLNKVHHIMEEIKSGTDFGHLYYRKYVEEQPKRFNKQLKKITSFIQSL